jgi:thiamine biosynthesis lipoprotein
MIYQGEAQGTTFVVKYYSKTAEDFEEAIDSMLLEMDFLFSTYKEDSWISQFNNSKKGLPINRDFMDLWEKCWELNIETDGYFDPTLSKVFKTYAAMNSSVLDSAEVIQALSHTGMHLIVLRHDSLVKKDALVEINLNAVAQGYSVDVIASFLEMKNIKNFLVEIGGEVRSSGVNENGNRWTIGIDKPQQGRRDLFAKAALKDQSLATSGNYRQFKEINGKKIGHIINPKTGFPVSTNVLSASVFAQACYRADALATAIMNWTVPDIIEFDQNTQGMSLLLIYLDQGDTVDYVSPDLLKVINR